MQDLHFEEKYMAMTGEPKSDEKLPLEETVKVERERAMSHFASDVDPLPSKSAFT